LQTLEQREKVATTTNDEEVDPLGAYNVGGRRVKKPRSLSRDSSLKISKAPSYLGKTHKKNNDYAYRTLTRSGTAFQRLQLIRSFYNSSNP
jgi:hypothetical protein